MAAADVLAVLDAIEQAGCFVSVDGGWGVDALLGDQTRPHDDLDLVIDVDEIETVRAALTLLGFRLQLDEMPTRFVVSTCGDRRIDFHPMYFDDTGFAHQRLPGGRLFTCRSAALDTACRIAGRAVRCLSAELQLAAHTGYPPDESDILDIRQLCDRFQLSPPPGYPPESG